MAHDMGDDHWTAEARTNLVLKILEGQLSPEDAATMHGLDVAEIEQWKRDFLAGGKRAVGESKQARRKRNATAIWVVGGILTILGVCLVLGIVGGAVAWLLFRERPTAAQKECHGAVVAMLEGLEEPMTITAYTTGGLEELDQATEKLDAMLTTWARQANGKLVYQHVVADSEETRQKALEEGLQASTFGSADSAQAMALHGFFGLVVEYKAEKGVIVQLAPEQMAGIEFWIASKIREVRAKADDERIGVAVLEGAGQIGLGSRNLVGRGGGSRSPSIEQILNQALPYYEIRKTKADGGVEALRDNHVLVVTQPSRDLTDAELHAIDAFLMLGNKTLVFWTSAVNTKAADHEMRATLDRHRLEKLLDGYGIELQKNLVTDPKGAMEIPVPAAMGRIEVARFPAVTIVKHDASATSDDQQLETNFPAFFRFEQVALPLASSLVLHPEKQPGASLRAVIRSSAATTVIDSEEIALMERAMGERAASSRVLGAALSGTIKSAFGNGEAQGRVLVVASSQFVTNPFAHSGNTEDTGEAFQMFGETGGDKTLQALASPYAQSYLTTTILSVKNTLDWGSTDEGMQACATLLIERSESATTQ